mmetsp:Transcript_6178/g.8944  ORF Transcript_6178/g.8944 Transcript_6178/m.8944 type:complete len:159 (-) Transcript_6178:19-495(-)
MRNQLSHDTCNDVRGVFRSNSGRGDQEDSVYAANKEKFPRNSNWKSSQPIPYHYDRCAIDEEKILEENQRYYCEATWRMYRLIQKARKTKLLDQTDYLEKSRKMSMKLRSLSGTVASRNGCQEQGWEDLYCEVNHDVISSSKTACSGYDSELFFELDV